MEKWCLLRSYEGINRKIRQRNPRTWSTIGLCVAGYSCVRHLSSVDFVTTVTILVMVTQNKELTTLNVHTIFPTHIRTYHMPFLDMLQIAVLFFGGFCLFKTNIWSKNNWKRATIAINVNCARTEKRPKITVVITWSSHYG